MFVMVVCACAQVNVTYFGMYVTEMSALGMPIDWPSR
jgi:hypothetical protein